MKQHEEGNAKWNQNLASQSEASVWFYSALFSID